MTVETPHLRLVPFSEAHLSERYVGWLNDPEVVRYSRQRHQRHTIASCRSYWRSFEGTPNLFWAIEAKDRPQCHIGNITVMIDPADAVADVSILIGERSVWGRGYGAEAFRATCDHLFDVTAVRKITAGTIAPNVRMLSLMRRIGMSDDGRRIRHSTYEGEEVDVFYGALFRDDRTRSFRP